MAPSSEAWLTARPRRDRQTFVVLKRKHRIDPATHLRTIEQAAAELGLSALEVQRALESGQLRGVKTPTGGRWRVHPAELAAYRDRDRLQSPNDTEAPE